MHSPPRVLLVEDNDDNRLIYMTALRHGGFAVTHASDGFSALDLAREQTPDLILMDISIPGLDGLEVTRRLKSDRALSTIPIIALTAHALLSDEERALAAGCDGYLAKPIDPKDVLAEVRRRLGRDGRS
jgi:two-component system, cell cycle response regulator DivK